MLFRDGSEWSIDPVGNVLNPTAIMLYTEFSAFQKLNVP